MTDLRISLLSRAEFDEEADFEFVCLRLLKNREIGKKRNVGSEIFRNFLFAVKT